MWKSSELQVLYVSVSGILTSIYGKPLASWASGLRLLNLTYIFKAQGTMQRFWMHYRGNEREPEWVHRCLNCKQLSCARIKCTNFKTQSYLSSVTRKYGKYILWLQFLFLGGSETSPGHYQNWIYGDVMTNDNMAAKTRRTIQIKSILSSFRNLKAAFSQFLLSAKKNERGVLEFRGKNLTRLSPLFWFLHDRTPNRWKNQVLCNFFLTAKKMA